MAAGFPAHRGGNAAGANVVLAEQPEQLGTSEALEAQSTAMRKMLHLFEQLNQQLGNAGGPGAVANLQANVDAVANDLDNLARAARTMTTREKSTRTLQPMTRLPAAGFGAAVNIANIRLNTIKPFGGVGEEPREVIRWLGKILELARTHALANDPIITLLIHASTGEVTDFITELREEGNTLDEIIKALELRYGDLCLPEEAVVKCNSLVRRPDESLPSFLDRLRHLAKMAKRMIDNDADRRAATNQLIEANIRRVLPNVVRNALEERILVRTRMGLPPFSTREIEKECIELEKKREERRQEFNQPRPNFQKKPHFVRSVKGYGLGELQDSDSDLTTTDDNDSDTGLESLVAEIRYAQNKFARKGKPMDEKKIRKYAFKRINRGFEKKAEKGEKVALLSQDSGRGPPMRLTDSPRRTIAELLALANCERGDCIHCGTPGHFMRQDPCPLRGKVVVDKACPACKKGLHGADDCPRVYQKRAAAANQVAHGDETLNEY